MKSSQNGTPRTLYNSASSASVLRASQKDATFISQLTTSLSDIIKTNLGGTFWIKYHSHINALCEFTYCALTTLSLRQTLGEEYTGIIQTDSSLRRLPSNTARVIAVVLQCFGPLILKHLLRRLERSLNSEGELPFNVRREVKDMLLSNLSNVFSAITIFQQLHLALFYLKGAYYHFGKRVTGTKHILVRKYLDSSSGSPSLRLLGYVILAQSVVTLLHSFFRKKKLEFASKKLPKEPKEVSGDLSAPQCPLCLSPRSQPTLSTCGHVFCWQCIHHALLWSGQHCPLCRYSVQPHQLVPLYNAA